MTGYAVIRAGSDNEDDAEAYGPFVTRPAAEQFALAFEEWVNPGYGYIVVELHPVRDGQRQIREEKEADL